MQTAQLRTWQMAALAAFLLMALFMALAASSAVLP